MTFVLIVFAFGLGMFVSGRIIDKKLAPSLENFLKELPDRMEEFAQASPDIQKGMIAEMKKTLEESLL